MANLPISVLPNVNANGVTPTDLLVIVNYDVFTGTTKNITAFDLQTYITSGITDDIITGGTYSGGALVLNAPGGPINISGFTEPFSGGSGNCITDLYITNLHGCSPITIYDSLQFSGSVATGLLSHAEGGLTTAVGNYSHAEGQGTIANGDASHTEGYSTMTNGNYQHAQGMWNVTGDTTQGAFIIGNGTDANNRSNLVFAAGNEVNISGKTITTNLQVTSGATSGYVLTSDASGNATWQTPTVTADTYTTGFTYADNTFTISDSSGNTLNATMTDGSKWVGGVLGLDEKIYTTPEDSSDLLVIEKDNFIANKIQLKRGISAHYNKF